MNYHDSIKPVADVAKTCESIVRLLQAEPSRYKLFGCFWWAVKRILKQHGYTREHLYLLGPFTDPEAEGQLPAETDAYLLAHAVEEQKRRAFAEWGSGDCYFPDGEPYRLDDPDAGGI